MINGNSTKMPRGNGDGEESLLMEILLVLHHKAMSTKAIALIMQKEMGT